MLRLFSLSHFFFFFFMLFVPRDFYFCFDLWQEIRVCLPYLNLCFFFFFILRAFNWKKKLWISRILHRYYFRKKLRKILSRSIFYQFVFAQIIIFLCYLHWIFSSILFEIAKNGVFLTICDGNLSFFFVFRFYSILNNEFRKLHDEAEIC